MASLLPNGEQQFCDANGAPYAGGLVYFYVPSTLTYKDTYQDAAQTILNTNPVALDAAGRAVIYGNGDYRQRLVDGLGNLIWDQETSSVVSQAMEPVVAAATTAAALALLGVSDAMLPVVQNSTLLGAYNDLLAPTGAKVESDQTRVYGLSAAQSDGVLQWSSSQDAGAGNQAGGADALMMFSDDASATFLAFTKSRNPTKGMQAAVHWQSQSATIGDDIGEISFNASDGSHYQKTAFITAYTAGPVSTGIVPSAISFWTTGLDGVDPTVPAFVVGCDRSLTSFPSSANALTLAPSGSTSGGSALIKANSAYSNSVPVYSFWWNDATGIGNPAQNELNVITGGTERARFTSTGALNLVNGIGLWGEAAPSSRPVVTGAHGANAALVSLLDALAAMGLITDSTT